MIKGIIITTLAGLAVGSLLVVYSQELRKRFFKIEGDDEDHYWDGKQTYNITELVAEGETNPFDRIREKIKSDR